MIVSTLFALTTLMGYPEAATADWGAVRAGGTAQGISALSVHVPVNLAYSSDLFFTDAAFNALKLAVPPDMRTDDRRSDETIAALKVEMVNMALGSAPYVPDYKQTVWTRPEGGYPIVRGELEAVSRKYTFDYCTDPASGELYIRGRVKNVGAFKGLGVVRLRRASAKESEVMEYHYIGYRWFADKWNAKDTVTPPVCSELSNAVASVEASWSMTERDYGRQPGFFGSSYTPEPHMRLMQGGNVLKVEKMLEPNEEFSFTIPAGFAPVAGEHPAFDDIVRRAKDYWDAFVPVKFDFGNARDNAIYRTLQFCNLQLLLNTWKDPSAPRLMTCQGGSSERFYCWTWEAGCELRPMVKIGYADPVRRALEFIFSLQDTCPPKGNFKTLEGSIGGTGQSWGSSTGSALVLAAEYLECTKDADFEKRHFEDMVRAANWIVGEVSATTNGLMPCCLAGDGDTGIAFIDVDPWCQQGVARVAAMLRQRGDKRAAAMQASADRYFKTLDSAIRREQLADGSIPAFLGDASKTSFEFRNMPSGTELLLTGMYDPTQDKKVERCFRYNTTYNGDGPFPGLLDANVRYIGNYEAEYSSVFQQFCEWKPAYLARQAYMNCAMTRDLYITNERYPQLDVTFTPWQPNASNNGRGIRLMTERFILDGASRLVLMGGFAPFERGDVFIDSVHTRFGRAKVARRGGELTAEFERELPEGWLVIVPEHHGFVPAGDSLERVDANVWRVRTPCRTIAGALTK